MKYCFAAPFVHVMASESLSESESESELKSALKSEVQSEHDWRQDLMIYSNVFSVI